MEKITVIGLGYVGLPLSVELAKHYPVVGFDVKEERISELSKGIDITGEADQTDLNQVIRSNPDFSAEGGIGLYCSNDPEKMTGSHYYIITVPTPIDKHNSPDLGPILSASEMVGKKISKGAIVIYESTVYPGLTEEECVPILEQESGLTYNKDFYVGYSPERINPGDQQHKLKDIKKVTAGSKPEITEEVDQLYQKIIQAGTHKAPEIKVAEAAKVIENAQRDINIAFVNELAKICNRLNIDTRSVLEAASTKWNFLPFTPGLVGGHCIGVDPYYLSQKAQEVGHHPELILAGRRMNDSMGHYVATELVKMMAKKGHKIVGSNILMLGITFKENCPDIRNSRAIDIVNELVTYDINVDVYDPEAYPEEVKSEFGLDLVRADQIHNKQYDGIVLAVGHEAYRSIDLQSLKNDDAVVFDVKGFLPREEVNWRL